MNWQPMQIPFAAGLDTKSDARASSPPNLDIARNVQFDELGGLQCRKPYASLGLAILGGGTVTNPRKVVANGDELLLFTKDALYSWVAEASAWAKKSDYVAVTVDEQVQFSRTGDQSECDRAELAGVAFYTWVETNGSTSVCYAAALDAATGSIVCPPMPVGSSASHPRLVALATRVLLFFVASSGSLYVLSLDPANVATSLGAAATVIFAVGSGFSDHYDACRVIGTDTAVWVARRSPTTSYTIGTLTANLAGGTTVNINKSCTGAIAVSSSPTGAVVQVVRSTNTAVLGDQLDAVALTTNFVDQAIGANPGRAQIAAAHRSIADGAGYRCYVWWTDAPSDTVAFDLRNNWVDTANALGTETRQAFNLDVGSRAFDVNGRVFVWTAYAMTSGVTFGQQAGFKAQLQDSYFLYRDDGTLCAKAARTSGGGYRSAGHLPGVQLGADGRYAWCGTTRRIIPLGKQSTGYAARAPLSIATTFDDDRARRCIRLGKTLYITGGEILQYDGAELTEVGFHVFPANIGAINGGSGGNIPDGTYAYKATYRWDNAKGERDRSTTATVAEVVLATGGTVEVISQADALEPTHRTGVNVPVIEFWRTEKNPTDQDPFYLVTSNDPSAFGIGVLNGYVASSRALGTGTVTDALADADLALREPNGENGGVSQRIAPPAAKCMCATQDRLFLGDVAGDRDAVWYSRYRDDGEVASFGLARTIAIPAAGGKITALAILNETLVVFREHAVYIVPGQGYDNANGGSNYGPAHQSAVDVGALNQESVAVTPFGLLFKGTKGWYLLDTGWSCTYVGAPVSAFDAETVLAAHVIDSQHQVRIVTSGRVLVFDYLVKQWAEWTIAGALGAAVWKGTHAYVANSGVALEQSDYSTADYDIDVETAWIKLADLQGAGSVRRIQPIGAWQSQHVLRMRVARDYEKSDDGNWAYYDDVAWTPNTSVVGDKLQMKHGPSRPRCSAIKIRLTTERTPSIGGDLLKLTGLGLEVGLSNTLNRRLSAAQKA